MAFLTVLLMAAGKIKVEKRYLERDKPKDALTRGRVPRDALPRGSVPATKGSLKGKPALK